MEIKCVENMWRGSDRDSSNTAQLQLGQMDEFNFHDYVQQPPVFVVLNSTHRNVYT
jgi:hypothetical protein